MAANDDTTLQVHLSSDEAARLGQLAAAAGLEPEEFARRQLLTDDPFVSSALSVFHALRVELTDVDAVVDQAA